MTIKDLIPWNKGESDIPVRRTRKTDKLLDLRSQMNSLFDEFFDSFIVYNTGIVL